MRRNPVINDGFTLLEILIALAIFAILATLTSQSLRQSLLSRTQLFHQAERLHDLQLTFSRLTHDTLQATNRPIYGDDMRLFPALIGQPFYIEFTRGGASDHGLSFRQTHLSRVGYLCQQHQLIRRTFPQLDSLKRQQFDDEIMLTQLAHCQFAFVSATSQWLPVWRGGTLINAQSTEALPSAIQLTLRLKDWGEVVSLFILPEAAHVITPTPPQTNR